MKNPEKHTYVTEVASAASFEEAAREISSVPCLVEFVRELGAKAPSPLYWDGKQATPRCQHPGHFDYPPCDPDALAHLRLPSRPQPYGSTKKLFSELRLLFETYTGISRQAAAVSAHSILTTWLMEAVMEAPRLSVIARTGTSAQQFLTLMELLCRRAIRLVDLNCSMFGQLPCAIQPTLLLDLSEISSGVARAIRASSVRGNLALSGRGFVYGFYPMVICTPTPLIQRASLGYPFEIVLPPTRTPALSLFNEGVRERLAEEFQGKLLLYRLENLSSCRIPDTDLSMLSTATQPLARTLMTAVVGDDQLRESIPNLLREQDEDIVAERAEELDSILVEALLVLCHEGKPSATCAQIAEIASGVIENRGGRDTPSPESIGRRLAGLGFRSRPIGRTGRGLRFSAAISDQIHNLARSLDVCSMREIEAGACPSCTWRQKN